MSNTTEMFCDRCKEVVDAVERNDGYATSDYGHYDVYVNICPRCGNTDLEEIDLEKLDIDWELDEEMDKLSAYDSEWSLTGDDDYGNEYIATGTMSCGELVNIIDIERVEK